MDTSMHRGVLGLALLLVTAGPVQAVEYRLQVANLYANSFVHYFDGPVGTGSGELAMHRLEQALDTDKIPNGASSSIVPSATAGRPWPRRSAG